MNASMYLYDQPSFLLHKTSNKGVEKGEEVRKTQKCSKSIEKQGMKCQILQFCDLRIRGWMKPVTKRMFVE